MKTPAKTGLISKILIIGAFLALLAYVAHPGIGDFHIIVNGEPLGSSAAYFAAVPTILLIALFVGILVALVILEVGMMLFTAFLFLGVFGLALLIPYFWPVLILVMLTLLLSSLGGNKLQ